MAETGPISNHHQPTIGAHRKPAADFSREGLGTLEATVPIAKKTIGPDVEWLTALPISGPRPFTYTMGKREVSSQPTRLKQQTENMQQIASRSLNLSNHL